MRALLSLLVALLTVAYALYTSCHGPDPSDPTTAKAQKPKAAAWRSEKGLRPAVLPAGAPERSRRSVVFLPTINRSQYRIHPSLQDGFGQTLAVFSTAFLELEAIAPWQARALAREIGAPPSYSASSRFSLDAPAAREAAERVGAASLVWFELGADLTLTLHAYDFADAAVAHWNGLALALENPRKPLGEPGGDLDRRLYDAPRALLVAMARSGRFRGANLRPQPAPDGGLEALAEVRAQIGSARPDELRRAEARLARLIAQQPGWSQPWAELSTLRMLRALSLGRPFSAAILREGPDVSRHVARALGKLGGETRARLDAVDYAVLRYSTRAGELEKVVGKLAPGDPMRAALARLDSVRDRSLYGLGGVDAITPIERLLVASGAVGESDARRLAAEALGEELGVAATLSFPALLGDLEEAADARGEWDRARLLAGAAAQSSAAGAMEVARGVCLAIEAGSDARGQCLDALHAGLARHMKIGEVELPEQADLLVDDAIWSELLASLAETALDARVLADDCSCAVPNLEGARDDWFRSLWLLAAVLSDTANGVLEARDAASPTARLEELLLSEARVQLSAPIERILEAAYVPAVIGGRKRAEADASDPYLKALAPFDAYPAAARLHATVLDARGRRELSAELYDRIARADPYDERWLGDWIGYVEYRESIDWGGVSYAETADWLATLVPRTRATALAIAHMTQDRAQDRGVGDAEAASEAEAKAARVAPERSSTRAVGPLG